MGGPQLSSQPRTVQTLNSLGRSTVVTAAGQYVPSNGGSWLALATGGGIPGIPFHRDDWDVYDRELLLELELWFQTGNNSPATSLYVSLFSMALGSSTVNPTNVLGAEVPGSRTPTEVFAAGNENRGPIRSGAFAPPAPGIYVAIVTTSSAMAANSAIAMLGRLNVLTR